MMQLQESGTAECRRKAAEGEAQHHASFVLDRMAVSLHSNNTSDDLAPLSLSSVGKFVPRNHLFQPAHCPSGGKRNALAARTIGSVAIESGAKLYEVTVTRSPETVLRLRDSFATLQPRRSR
jgi:hypothetical protein